MKDFTIKKYEELLKALVNQGFFFMSFEQFIQRPKDRFILLRHDVDTLPINSLKTAKIEHDLGIKGTYYFRIVPESYDENIIKQIAKLGHEIGYHYENLSTCGGDFGSAIDDFRLNLEKLKKLYLVKTICMHGSPLSKYDNRKLWEKYYYRDFGIIGEPYFDVDFGEVLYLTDTGRRWDGVSRRDKVSSREYVVSRQMTDGLMDGETKGLGDEVKKSGIKIRLMNEKRMTLNEKLGLRFRSTQDIIDAAEGVLLPDRIMITVHPQRWSDSFLPWMRELVWQN